MKRVSDPAAILSIGVGVFWFLSLAIMRPVFGRFLYDIPLYLGLGVAAITVFFGILFGAATLLGESKIKQEEKITLLGGGVIACAFLASAASILIAADWLAKHFNGS